MKIPMISTGDELLLWNPCWVPAFMQYGCQVEDMQTPQSCGRKGESIIRLPFTQRD